MSRFSSRPPVLPHDRTERRDTAASQYRRPSDGHEAGVPEFPEPLPGSHHYGDKPETPVRHDLDVGPAEPYYSKGMAHGVAAPPSHGGRPAPRPEHQHDQRAGRDIVEQETKPRPRPVPVYIVAEGGGAVPIQKAALRSVPVPAPGADPIVLVPRNFHRTSVRLLNESANPVRITFDLSGTGGALLPASMTSYLEIDCQDEICAYQPAGNSGVAAVSVIDQYDDAAAG
jgi:hypothetical protein